MTTFERLAKRIEKDCGVKLINFRRSYAGHWQKSAGAFLWIASYADNPASDVGSAYTATELLKSKEPLILTDFGWPYSKEIDKTD